MYMPAVLNVVTNGNGTGTKNVLKGTVRYPVFCLRVATTVVKVKLFSTWTRSTVRFYSMLVYFGFVYVTMITGTRN